MKLFGNPLRSPGLNAFRAAGRKRNWQTRHPKRLFQTRRDVYNHLTDP
jgi:hypothetical protein